MGRSKGPVPVFILLPRDGEAHTVAAQVLPHLATPVGFVTHQMTRQTFRAPAPGPFHGPACHQSFEGDGFVPLSGVRASVINWPPPSARTWTVVLKPS